MGVDTHHNAGTASEGGGDATIMHEQPDVSLLRIATAAARLLPPQLQRPPNEAQCHTRNNSEPQQHTLTTSTLRPMAIRE
jgi:hypothetical protein